MANEGQSDQIVWNGSSSTVSLPESLPESATQRLATSREDEIAKQAAAAYKADVNAASNSFEKYLFSDLYGLDDVNVDNGVQFTTRKAGEFYGYRKKIVVNPNELQYNNYFTLVDYCWFPSSYKRMLTKDLYRKMLYAAYGTSNTDSGNSSDGKKDYLTPFAKLSKPLDFYESAGLLDKMVGKLQTLVRGQVQSTMAIASGIGSSVTGAISSVKGLFSKSSSSESGDHDFLIRPEKITPLDINHKPHIKVYEYKVDSQLSQVYQFMKILFRILGSISQQDASKPDQYFKDFEKKLIEGLYDTLIFLMRGAGMTVGYTNSSPTWADIKYLLTKFMGDDRSRILGLPIAMYECLVPGTYEGYYELPIIENEVPYLGSSGSGGWTPPGTDETHNKIIQYIEDISGMGFNVPLGCRWKYDQSSKISSLGTNFTLFNDTMSAYRKNMRFIHTLTAGSKWYNDVVFSRPPCLYDVELSGSFRWMFCNMEILVKKVGKTRYINVQDFDTRFAGAYMSDFSVRKESLCFVPDAFSVDITFTPLVPDNYNMYMNYIINGGFKHTVGYHQDTMLTEIFKIIGNKIKEATNLPEQKK